MWKEAVVVLFKVLPHIRLTELSNHNKNTSHVSRCPGSDPDQAPPEYIQKHYDCFGTGHPVVFKFMNTNL